MPAKCCVINCSEPVVANMLCRKHYMRVKRHGTVEQTRSSDWGKRDKHPSYVTWAGLKRQHLQNMAEEWKEDFWKFVADVGEKPSGTKAHRKNDTLPWSKDNFYWKEHQVSPEATKEYMREWRKKARAENAEYYENSDLMKNYGVTRDWYYAKLAEQNGVCAICKNPETMVIRGKLVKLAVDHNHETGAARGLLCTACNRGLGLMKDDAQILARAIEYLKAHQPAQQLET